MAPCEEIPSLLVPHGLRSWAERNWTSAYSSSSAARARAAFTTTRIKFRALPACLARALYRAAATSFGTSRKSCRRWLWFSAQTFWPSSASTSPQAPLKTCSFSKSDGCRFTWSKSLKSLKHVPWHHRLFRRSLRSSIREITQELCLDVFRNTIAPPLLLLLLLFLLLLFFFYYYYYYYYYLITAYNYIIIFLTINERIAPIAHA